MAPPPIDPLWANAWGRSKAGSLTGKHQLASESLYESLVAHLETVTFREVED